SLHFKQWLKLLLQSWLWLAHHVLRECRPVCVDAVSDTEAVLGRPMKLTCVSCMKREEITKATFGALLLCAIGLCSSCVTNWLFYTYLYLSPSELHIFQISFCDGRLQWNGSKDLQDVSISIIKIRLNDSGRYECVVHRQFSFNLYTPSMEKRVEIKLVVKEKDFMLASILIMMYVLLVFLTFWLLVEMIYCYRKISKSDEQTQDSAVILLKLIISTHSIQNISLVARLMKV
uniref:Sodium channel regulatory subunit beta-3 n=1 Tax=Electrophorus electricus TaxID=8005 RepID=A0A4W4G8R7_ELEEL